MANIDQIINKITHEDMKSLDLRGKYIKEEGAKSLAEALKENSTRYKNTTYNFYIKFSETNNA